MLEEFMKNIMNNVNPQPDPTPNEISEEIFHLPIAFLDNKSVLEKYNE